MTDSFAQLGAALTERILELKRLTLLRIEDGAKEFFQQDLSGLETSVRALEAQVATLKTCISQEMTAMPKVEALIQASKLQSEHLSAISQNLPARLPRSLSANTQGALPAAGRPMPPGAGALTGVTQTGTSGQGAAGSVAEDAARRRKEVPRCYVTESELAATSAYMRGRLQLDKVNAALDELANHAAGNVKLMAAAKAGGAKLAPADRKRATELLHSIALKDGIKGHFWLLESDLREGQLVRLDKSGKALLTLLRHLGRLTEVRCNLDGVAVTAYVLVEDARRPG
ncbi:Spindle and kinetochore-associated protein 1 [Tetrabaena socialis]|uniref:Spindle and kinetochore-associated protein 1 n=1 Tax=Tetrabaena socialis TaxID=47790 RepID=A0A2J7ZS13_9CHLO|nr:Spindle and kinetochore-associated protein 1 [Tetrabaena socialis]|eukprot:PNH03055.1 Spindle and kinetochore-associated protein 1 [Tetrabaena socialis]